MKHAGIWFIGILMLIHINCASYKTSLYEREVLTKVDAWFIDFSYMTGELERRVASDGKNETRITDMGYSARDLQLKQDLFYALKDRYRINLIKEKNLASGFIKILPVHFESGGFLSLDVTLYDAQDTLLGRTKIKNGTRNATFKGDDNFATYSAEAIYNLIKARVPIKK